MSGPQSGKEIADSAENFLHSKEGKKDELAENPLDLIDSWLIDIAKGYPKESQQYFLLSDTSDHMRFWIYQQQEIIRREEIYRKKMGKSTSIEGIIDDLYVLGQSPEFLNDPQLPPNLSGDDLDPASMRGLSDWPGEIVEDFLNKSGLLSKYGVKSLEELKKTSYWFQEDIEKNPLEVSGTRDPILDISVPSPLELPYEGISVGVIGDGIEVDQIKAMGFYRVTFRFSGQALGRVLREPVKNSLFRSSSQPTG